MKAIDVMYHADKPSFVDHLLLLAIFTLPAQLMKRWHLWSERKKWKWLFVQRIIMKQSSSITLLWQTEREYSQ